MKKTIIAICLIGSLLILLDTIDFEHSLVLLLFAGVIPGTDIVISPINMMAATATAMTVVILRLTAWPQIKAVFADQPKTKPTARRII